jgi:hypothetical protein
MDAWLIWFNASFWTWLFDLVPWIQARANDTESWANQASQSATTAGLTANALMWNASTNYALGQNAISPTNFQTYRRRVAGTSATDPASDATNWTAVAAVPDASVTTEKLANDAVTFATMQNIATAVILGRSTAGTGDVEALTALPAGVTAPASSIAGALNASGAAPLFACRAWVNFNGTGTVAIRGSGNVSSITDNGVGIYTVNFTTAMPDVNYATVITGKRPSESTAFPGFFTMTLNTGSMQMVALQPGVSFYDSAEISVTIFR